MVVHEGPDADRIHRLARGHPLSLELAAAASREVARIHEAGGRTGARQKMGEGIKQGIGVLSALKEALEETIQEARERGDLSTGRAKEVMKEALGKAQAAASAVVAPRVRGASAPRATAADARAPMRRRFDDDMGGYSP